MMNQHENRRIAMQAIFLANQNPGLKADQVEAKTLETLDLQRMPAYSDLLISGILGKKEELEKELAAHLKKGWCLERVNPITVAILEVALYEIKYSSHIDPKAAINEALNLGDEFADKKAKSFINGVLANFIKE